MPENVDKNLSFKYKLFKKMDNDGSGRLTTSEIANYLNKVMGLGIPLAHINDVIRATDDSGDGKLSFREWALANIEGLETAKASSTKIKANEEQDGPNPFFKLGYLSVFKVNELREIFRTHATENDVWGPIIEDMDNLLIELGHGNTYNIEKLKTMLRRNNREHNPKTRFGEFCSLWVCTQPGIADGILFKYNIFTSMDADDSGRITATELAEHLREEEDEGITEEII